ncbi:MAG: hypothetical protein K8R53_05255 [Bacteroidales bacterium]|nr:hypothetical protein [Bacteroidales bacterium]
MLKIHVVILLIIFLANSNLGKCESVSQLETLENKGIIKYTATGNDSSTHYLKPIILKIKNLSRDPVNIELAQGRIFNSEKKDVQDVIVTKQQVLALQGKSEIEAEIYAMCIEASKKPPNS